MAYSVGVCKHSSQMFSQICWLDRSRGKKEHKNWSILTNELLPNLLQGTDDQIFSICVYLESQEILTGAVCFPVNFHLHWGGCLPCCVAVQVTVTNLKSGKRTSHRSGIPSYMLDPSHITLKKKYNLKFQPVMSPAGDQTALKTGREGAAGY